MLCVMRIKQYRLMSGESSDLLEAGVNKLITQGWQPFGSPFIVAPSDKDPRYFQAVVLMEGEIAGR